MADLDEWLTKAARTLWIAQGREDLDPKDWPDEIGMITSFLKQAYDRGRADGRNAAPDRMIARFLGEEEPC
jgi:hypothetical protein